MSTVLKSHQRFWELDTLRGLALALMVGFHFFVDLSFLGVNRWVYEQPLRSVGVLAAGLFIIVSGAALAVSLQRWQNRSGAFAHHLKRIFLLAGLGIVITAVTWVYPHEGFIFFGILHFLAVASLIGVVLSKKRMLLLAAVLLSLPLAQLLGSLRTDNMALVALGWGHGLFAYDLFPIVPWFGLFGTGMLLGYKSYGPKGRAFEMPKWPRIEALEWAGRHSLAIYLVHQPVLIAILKISLGR